MIGDPAQFEAIGNRLGFQAINPTPQKLCYRWQGARFPAFLCLGIAVLLLIVSVPILEALRQRGFVGPAGSLWYFPLMNLVLFAIAVFLVTQRRAIEVYSEKRQIVLRRQSLYRTILLIADFDEVDSLAIGLDQVYSGFAIGGSTSAEQFPVPALRIALKNGQKVLLDRSSLRRLIEIGKAISARMDKPLHIDPGLQAQIKA